VCVCVYMSCMKQCEPIGQFECGWNMYWLQMGAQVSH